MVSSWEPSGSVDPGLLPWPPLQGDLSLGAEQLIPAELREHILIMGLS